jgi:hypothetical protein
MEILLGLSLALLGIVAGIYVSTSIHDHRIGDLSAAEFTAMHQMRDKTFRMVMPVLGLSTFAFVLVSAAIALAPGTPRLLGGAAAALMLIDIGLTVTRSCHSTNKYKVGPRKRSPATGRRCGTAGHFTTTCVRFLE